MTSTMEPSEELVSRRPLWRSVVVPTEHGGWGLTLEPVLLGLLVAWSWPGFAIGVAAFTAFLVRTPSKLALVDRRRGRSLPRTRLAARVAVAEFAALVSLGALALWWAGPGWFAVVVAALPLVALELWFDVRSRGRRLVPELAGAVGIAAVASAIIVAGDGGWRLAVASWMVLGARAIASIPYVRAQIVRSRGGVASTRLSDLAELCAVAVSVAAFAVEVRVLLGAVAVAAIAAVQAVALRRSHVPPAKVVGLRQMAFGVAVVAATALGVLL